MRVVDGTPKWAVRAAWAALISVLPSGIWRVCVGLGLPLGWSDEHLRLQQIPGVGTAYVIALTLLSICAAGATLGLVHPIGDRVPASLVAVAAFVGALVVAAICCFSVIS